MSNEPDIPMGEFLAELDASSPGAREDGLTPGHTFTPVPYIPDGSRVVLDDGSTGIVRHDMGGEAAPVYIDGVNNSGYPHDYTNVPRHQVALILPPELDSDTAITYYSGGYCAEGCCQEMYARCACGSVLDFSSTAAPPRQALEEWRNEHGCNT